MSLLGAMKVVSPGFLVFGWVRVSVLDALPSSRLGLADQMWPGETAPYEKLWPLLPSPPWRDGHREGVWVGFWGGCKRRSEGNLFWDLKQELTGVMWLIITEWVECPSVVWVQGGRGGGVGNGRLKSEERNDKYSPSLLLFDLNLKLFLKLLVVKFKDSSYFLSWHVFTQLTTHWQYMYCKNAAHF